MLCEGHLSLGQQKPILARNSNWKLALLYSLHWMLFLRTSSVSLVNWPPFGWMSLQTWGCKIHSFQQLDQVKLLL